MRKWIKLYWGGGERLVFQTEEENEWGLPAWVMVGVPPLWFRFGRFWYERWFVDLVSRLVLSVISGVVLGVWWFISWLVG